MSDRDDQAQRIMERIASMNSELSEEQAAQVVRMIDETVTDSVAKALAERQYKPAPDSPAENILDGTVYGRMGLDGVDVQLARAVLSDAQRRGLSKRGPSETLDNLADALQKRAIETDSLGTRAMDTTDSSSVVGTEYVSEVWRAAEEQAKILPTIRQFPMAEKTTTIPIYGAPIEPQIYSESTADDAADYETQDVGFTTASVTTTKFGLHQKWSGELEEDSFVALVSAVRERQQDSLAHYTDSTLVNGDTTIAAGNIMSGDAAPSGTKFYTAFDGIRHAAQIDNTNNALDCSGTLTWEKMTDTLRGYCIDRTYLNDWSHPTVATDFIYLVNPEGYETVRNLDELVTLDKAGAQAAVLQGQLGWIGVNPLIVTMAVPLTQADGFVDASGNTKDLVVAYNRNAFSIGYRRQIEVETYRVARRDQNGIILFYRMGLARYSPTGAAGGIESVAVAYNW